MSLMRATKLLMQGARPLRPQDVFATSLYTGNGGTQTITNGLDLAGKGGLVWGKARNNSSNHELCDTNRGARGRLLSNETQSEQSTGDVSGFTSTGFTLEPNSGDLTRSGVTHVAWSFREADKFFAIRLIQHTGTASTISLPSFGPIGMVIGKNRSFSGNWPVWHRSLPAGQGLRLNLSNGAGTTQAWISVSGQTITLSGSAPSGNYVLYVFAHNPDLIDCGSYVGNGSATGPVVTCGKGWSPQFMIVKNFTNTDNWCLLDTARGLGTSSDKRLLANQSENEASIGTAATLAPNGFQAGSSINASNNAYIYLAIRSPT